MKAIQIIRPNDLRIVDLEQPVPDSENNVLVSVTSCGICGSDIHIYHGTNAAATYPRIPGHEIVGVVMQVHSDSGSVKPGDRVIIDQVIPCGRCYACRHGRPNVCHSLKVRGATVDGGFRQYITVPDRYCYRIPDSLSHIEAVMIEPTTIAMQCCSRAALDSDDTVLILGMGNLGTSILKIVLQESPRAVIAADINDSRLADALAAGADHIINPLHENLPLRCRELTGDYGPTLSIDAACVPGSLLSLLESTGNAGRVITMGFSSAPDGVSQYLITSKELDIRGSRLQNRKFQSVIDRVNTGRLDLKGSVSHTFPFEEAQKAFDFIDSHDPSIRKVVLTF